MNSRLAMVRAERCAAGNSTFATGPWSSAFNAESETRFCGSTSSSVRTSTLTSLSMLARIFFIASPIGRPGTPSHAGSVRPWPPRSVSLEPLS